MSTNDGGLYRVLTFNAAVKTDVVEAAKARKSEYDDIQTTALNSAGEKYIILDQERYDDLVLSLTSKVLSVSDLDSMLQENIDIIAGAQDGKTTLIREYVNSRFFRINWTVNATGLPNPSSPSVVEQPRTAILSSDATLTLSAKASGSKPMTWAWFKGGVEINSATGTGLEATYEKSNIQTDDAGDYTVKFTNARGVAESETAQVLVNQKVVAPSITKQPTPTLVITSGESLTLTAGASGTLPVTWEWLLNGNPMSPAVTGTGVDSSLFVSSVDGNNTGTYTCRFTNSAGAAATDGAVVSVTTTAGKPVIAQQPPVTIAQALGTRINVSATATGTLPMTWKWRKDGQDITGAVGGGLIATYTRPSAANSDAGIYSVVFENSAGFAISDNSVLAINSTPPSAPTSKELIYIVLDSNYHDMNYSEWANVLTQAPGQDIAYFFLTAKGSEFNNLPASLKLEAETTYFVVTEVSKAPSSSTGYTQKLTFISDSDDENNSRTISRAGSSFNDARSRWSEVMLKRDAVVFRTPGEDDTPYKAITVGSGIVGTVTDGVLTLTSTGGGGGAGSLVVDGNETSTIDLDDTLKSDYNAGSKTSTLGVSGRKEIVTVDAASTQTYSVTRDDVGKLIAISQTDSDASKLVTIIIPSPGGFELGEEIVCLSDESYIPEHYMLVYTDLGGNTHAESVANAASFVKTSRGWSISHDGRYERVKVVASTNPSFTTPTEGDHYYAYLEMTQSDALSIVTGEDNQNVLKLDLDKLGGNSPAPSPSVSPATFTSRSELDEYFTANPTLLRKDLPLFVSAEDSDTVGDFVENSVMLMQWTGEDNPETYDEKLIVEASLMAGVSSLSLGEAHTFSSGGQNVFTINQISNSAFTNPWSEIGDHSTEEGRFVKSRPSAREYGDLEYVEIAGAVAESGEVEYSVSGENPDNQSLLGIELVAAESYTGRLSYDIKEETTGKLVYKQTFNVDVNDGDVIDWWFKFPIDSVAGDKATAELLKADLTGLKVRPSQNGEAYRKLKRRTFEIKELAYLGENSSDTTEIRTERVIDLNNENNSLVFNVGDATVLSAIHEVGLKSSDKISSKIADVDKLIVTSDAVDVYTDLNMNTKEIKSVSNAESDTSAPNFGQVKRFVSDHTGGRSEILVVASEDVQQYDVGVAQVGLDHIQMFTATTENKTIETSLQFFVPLDDDFLDGTIVEFSKRYFKGVDAQVRYFNNRAGQFIIHHLDDTVFAIQREGLNGWDVIEAADVPNPDQGIGWTGDSSGVHGHVLYAEADDGSTAKTDPEVTIGTIKGAQQGVVTNAGAISELDSAFNELAGDVVDNENAISLFKQDVEAQFKFDEVSLLADIGVTDEQIHAVHGQKGEIAKIFKTGGVRDGHKYVLRMNQFATKDLHGFLPNTLGGVLKVTSVNEYSHRDPAMDDAYAYVPPIMEHRVLFEFFDVGGDVWNAFLDADDNFTDFTKSSLPDDVTQELTDLRSEVDDHEGRITTNSSDISVLQGQAEDLVKYRNMPYTTELSDLGITGEQLDFASGVEAKLGVFRSATLGESYESFVFDAVVLYENSFHGVLPNTDGGVLRISTHASGDSEFTHAVFLADTGEQYIASISTEGAFNDWVAMSVTTGVTLEEFESYKTTTNATLQRLEETIGTLENTINTAFWKQELTYSNNVLKSEMTNIKGDTSDQTVTIVGSGGHSEVPNEFNVYVGWDTNDEITAAEILDLEDTSNGKLAIASSKDTLVGQSFATTRDNTDWKFSYIAFPKDAVSPDPSQVDYLGGQPAAWNRHEVVIDNLIYVVLKPQYANNEDDLSMVLTQE